MKKPVIAIVGRPNVGKSTLFNRIVRRREAIVDNQPGVTRDRKYMDVEWEGHTFTLVDTGGYIPKSQDIIETGVTQQVQLAIEEADCIILVVDVTTIVTDVDQMVVDQLRKSEKPVVLAVNKVDNENRELDAVEFHSLGLGDIVTISAVNGNGVGDLLSCTVKKINWPAFEQDSNLTNAIHLAIVGRPNVGKSTFVNTILGENRMLVTEIPGTTRDSVDVQITYKDKSYVLIDTAGMRRRSKISDQIEYYSVLRTRRVLDRCQVAAIFIDGNEGVTQQDMHVLQAAIDAKKGVMLIANKWDLVERDAEARYNYEMSIDKRLQGLDYVPVIRISCLKHKNLNHILDLAGEIYVERQRRIPTPGLNDLIEVLNRQYQAPSVQGKRPKIQFGAQVGVEPPTFAFFLNYPKLLKAAYKRYLENRIRDQFAFSGVPLIMVFKKKMAD